MADEEHPEGSGDGGGQERAAKGKTRDDKRYSADSGQGESASTESAPVAAEQAEPHPDSSPAGDPSPVYAPPASERTTMDSGSDRGISGALALWGPLIIIGFLVLVMNTDDTPERPSAAEVAALSRSAAAETVGGAAPAPPTTQTATFEEAPAESIVVAAAEPEVESAAIDAPPPGPETVEVAVTAEIEAESAEPAATADTSTQNVSPALEEPLAKEPESAEVAGDLDPGAVLEVARSVIEPAGAEASSRGVAVATSQAEPPPAPALPAASPTESQSSASAPALAAVDAPGIVPGSWIAPPSAYQNETPIWSTGGNPWAVPSSSQEEMTWGDGSQTPIDAGNGPDWPPPPGSAAGMPPSYPAPAMRHGPGYWPRPPVLVPCAPPYYWCIALPSPVYHPTPPGPYQ